PQSPSPAPHLLDVSQELEQVRSGPSDLRQRAQCVLPRFHILRSRTQSQNEQSRSVLRRPASVADIHYCLDRSDAVGLDALLYGIDVLPGQGPLRSVVRTTFRTQDQE